MVRPIIVRCIATAAAFTFVAGAAIAQNTDQRAGAQTPAAHTKIHKTTHRKKPVETYEWTEDTWTETHPVAPPPPPPPQMMTQRTVTTTTTTTGK